MSKKKKTIIITPFIIIGLLGLGFLIYQANIKKQEAFQKQYDYDYYVKTTNTFYKETYINEIDVSNKTINEVKSIFVDKIKERKIDILKDNAIVDTFSYNDLIFELNLNEKLSEILKSQLPTYEEYYGEVEKKEFEINIYDYLTINDIDLQNIKLLKKENQIPSEDAYSYFDEEKLEYKIQEEKLGTEIKDEIIKEKLLKAIELKEDRIVITNEDFIQPNKLNTDESLVNKVNFRNEVLSIRIKYDFGNNKEEITRKELSKMIIFGVDINILFNDTEIENFVKKLKQKYDTFGSTREFTTSDGQHISIPGGDYGWLINKGKEIEEIKKNILNKESLTREPIYLYKGQRDPKNEIGNSYVEINIEKQHVWMYKNGKCIVETDCVTGTKGKHDTPIGIYCLTYKTKDAILRGDDYASPVDYWMPFNKNIGMHDASWRNKFGGSIYLKNGSHGCINLPLSTAKTIYENLDNDMPIIVY